jgi:hypothetical protein
MTTKIINKQPKPTKRPMMRELFHGKVEPPHCSARRRETMAGIKNAAPMRSSSLRRVRRVWPEGLDWRGMERKWEMTAMENAPIGRL